MFLVGLSHYRAGCSNSTIVDRVNSSSLEASTQILHHVLGHNALSSDRVQQREAR
jgi:hypothetical protein